MLLREGNQGIKITTSLECLLSVNIYYTSSKRRTLGELEFYEFMKIQKLDKFTYFVFKIDLTG